MSDTISLVDHLLKRAQLFVRTGCRSDARRLINRLLDQPEITIGVRTEALRLLARVELEAGRFRWARRHLVAAICLTRYSDGLYVEYAKVIDADPEGDPKKAVKALRRAVSIDPMDIRSWSTLGRMAVAADDRRLAVKALRRAVALRPDTTDIVSEIIESFLNIGLDREAEDVLRAVRFRAPKGVNLAALDAQFKFDRVVREQESSRRDQLAATILAFPKVNREPQPLVATPVVLRADIKSQPRPHLLRMFGRRRDPRQAR